MMALIGSLRLMSDIKIFESSGIISEGGSLDGAGPLSSILPPLTPHRAAAHQVRVCVCNVYTNEVFRPNVLISYTH